MIVVLEIFSDIVNSKYVSTEITVFV
jgi:hypothetical protein